eukprot:7321862-Prymnesium_polylepis.1
MCVFGVGAEAPRANPALADARQVDAARVELKALQVAVQRRHNGVGDLAVEKLGEDRLLRAQHRKAHRVGGPARVLRRALQSHARERRCAAAFALAVQEDDDRPAAGRWIAGRKEHQVRKLRRTCQSDVRTGRAAR